jgi:hypothetical protein
MNKAPEGSRIRYQRSPLELSYNFLAFFMGGSCQIGPEYLT